MPVWLWLLLAALLTLIAAAAIGIGALVREGWGMFEDDARTALQSDPVIQARIGTIEQMTVDLAATGTSLHPDDFVFRLKGDRGEGRVTARFESTWEGERISRGRLTMKDGSEWPLAVEKTL